MIATQKSKVYNSIIESQRKSKSKLIKMLSKVAKGDGLFWQFFAKGDRFIWQSHEWIKFIAKKARPLWQALADI